MEGQDGELRGGCFRRTSAFSTYGQHVGLYKITLAACIPKSAQEMKLSTSFVSLAVLVTLSTPAFSVALWGQCGVSIATPLLYSLIKYYCFRARATLAPLSAMRAQHAFTQTLVCSPGFCKKIIIIIHSFKDYSQCLALSAGVTTTTTKQATSLTKTSTTTYKPVSNPGTSTAKPVTTSTSTTSSSSKCPGTLTKFKFFGVSEAGAEFGGTIPVGHLFISVEVCLYSHETREFWAPIIFGRLPGTFDLTLLL